MGLVEEDGDQMGVMKFVGTGQPARDHMLKRTEPLEARLVALAEYLPEVADYAMPDRNALTEKHSLFTNSGKFVRAPIPEGLELAVERLVAMTPRFKRPGYILPGPSVPPSLVELIVENLNPEANAGYPYCTQGLMKRDYCRANLKFVVDLVNMRLVKLRYFGWKRIRKMKPLERVKAGLCDPFRVIIKNEPHSIEKLSQGRERLVVCISAVDEIIDRILFTRPNKKLIGHFLVSYSALGIGFDDEKIRQVWETFLKAPLGEKVHSDMSAWEWSIQGWDHDADTEVILRTCDGLDDDFEDLVRARNECTRMGVYVISDGSMFEQTEAGVNKSGGYRTASLNTRTRAMNSLLVGANWQLCAGDDCVEMEVEDMVARYLRLGKRLKDKARADESFCFCSHEFTNGKAEPLNVVKAAYRYIVSEPSFEKLKQFAFVYQHSSKFERALEGLLSASRYGTPQAGEGLNNLQGETD